MVDYGRTLCLISIHAPREGSDAMSTYTFNVTNDISIHAPREGSDADGSMYYGEWIIFLSTLPARGATHRAMYSSTLSRFLSTLPARGATLCSF